MRRDGRRGSLLTIQKVGAVSTLDIVQRVRDSLPRIAATGNAVACGYNHRSDTPAGTGNNGRAGFGGCNENPANKWWELPGDEMAGVWSGNNVSLSGGAAADGIPVSSQSQPGFYAGPWEALGMTQAQFWAWAGAPQASMPANTNQNIYLDNDGTTQNASGSWTLGYTTTTETASTPCADFNANLYAMTYAGGAAYDSNNNGKIDNNESTIAKTMAGRATAPFIVDQHVVFGAGGSNVQMFGDSTDYNNGIGQAGVRILSWREVR